MTIISDELDDETKDLFVTIDNPEKHTTTMESYITFRVTTKVTTPEHVVSFCNILFLTKEKYFCPYFSYCNFEKGPSSKKVLHHSHYGIGK